MLAAMILRFRGREPDVRIRLALVIVLVVAGATTRRLAALVGQPSRSDSVCDIDDRGACMVRRDQFDELALEGHVGLEEQFRFFQGQHLSRRGLEDVRILARLHQDADFDPRAADPLDQAGHRRNAGEDRDCAGPRPSRRENLDHDTRTTAPRRPATGSSLGVGLASWLTIVPAPRPGCQ